MIRWDYLPPKFIRRRLLATGFFLLKFSVCKYNRLRSLGRSAHGIKRYHRPPRRYSIPAYQPHMAPDHEHRQYLRPTLFCNCQAPDVVALAWQLGAKQTPNDAFAAAAFNFVKRNITIELLPLDGVEKTLARGTGTCLHRVALLVALCRAAGIPARFKFYVLTSIDSLDETMAGDPLARQWNDELGELLFHSEAEVFLDGKWVVGSIGLTAERQASLGLPIIRFGEVALGVWYTPDPESIVQLESIPYGLNGLMRLVYRIAPAAIDNANANLLAQCQQGRAILERRGEQAYDEEARRTYKPHQPDMVMRERSAIRFEQ